MYKKRCFVSVGLSPIERKKKKSLIINPKKGEKMQKPKERTLKNQKLEFNISHFTLRLVALREIPTSKKKQKTPK